MDGETGQSLALHHNVGGLAKFLTSCSEGMKKDVGQFSIIWKHPGDRDNTCSTHVPDSRAVSNNAASPSRYLVNKSLQASPYSGSGREMLDYASTSPAFHTAACGAPPLCNCHPHVSHLTVGKGGMESPGDHLKASQAPPSTGNLVEVCPRRFLTYDDNGSNRMLINPPPANPFNVALPASSLNKAYMSYVMPPAEKSCDGKGVGLFVSSFPPAPHVPMAGIPNYCARYLWPQHTAMDSMSSTSDICHMPHFAHGEKTVVDGESDHGDGSPEVSSFSHENTEDIEALLSSDVDEVSSTGHSPCDLEENSFLPVVGPCETPGSFEEAKSGNCKRRFKEDGDLCSTATSTSKGDEHTSLLDVVDTVGVETKLPLPFQGVDSLKTMSYDTAMLGMSCADEVSSYNSAKNKKQCRELRSSHRQPPPPINANMSRKEKIKNILHLMREVIPGGETMDTAFVLDEAIQCIRTLQSAVNKLQAMQAPK